jgi:hypothetical protein
VAEYKGDTAAHLGGMTIAVFMTKSYRAHDVREWYLVGRVGTVCHCMACELIMKPGMHEIALSSEMETS